MKKFLSILSGFLLLTMSVNAQMMESPTRFGIKLGGNIAGYGSQGDINVYEGNTSPRIGFNGGVYGIFNISEAFAIQSEILYSLQGTNFVDPEYYVDYIYLGYGSVVPDIDAYGDIEARDNLHFLNIPILASFYVAPGFSIQIGPQVGFLLNGTAKFDNVAEAEEVFTEFEEATDITDQLNNISLAGVLGIQFEMRSGLGFGLRYNYGFTDVLDDTEDELTTTNQVGQLYVGYTF
ncbi:MAG: porin family protein [Candidatus Cyclobacteriaceae bacterium M3_2C_046]